MELLEQDTIPVQDDLDLPEPPAYLRRQQAVPVRRKRVSRRTRWVLAVAGAILSIALAGYGLAAFALTSSYFVLTSPTDIVVTGNNFVSRDDVLGALGLSLTGSIKNGTDVFRLSLNARRRGVESLPWVRAASITRILPHGLLVHIAERIPVAYANVGGRVSLVDSDGMLLEKPETGTFDFPVVSGLENLPGIEERRQRLSLYLEFMRELNGAASRHGWLISEVDLTDPEDLKTLLFIRRQTVRVDFGEKDFLQRFQSFLALLPEIQKSSGKLDSVDLRYRNQIVVAPQNAALPAVPGNPDRGNRKD